MFGNTFRQHFQVMGADVDVSVAGDRFQIGIDDGPGGERFQLRFPSDGSVTAKVLDADRRAQHLLLDVAHRGLGMQQKYLCGHDEFHWFVAALPQRRDVKTLSEAMEALKPQAVHREQAHKQVKRKRRSKRRTTAYVRQGEWFFVPRADFDADERPLEHNGQLVRGQGKPHRVQWLCMTTDGRTYARGNVSHPDHATLKLDAWHEVFRNTEAEPVVLASPKQAPRRRRFSRATGAGRAPRTAAVFDMRYLD